jgi:DNA-binding SARP family transcriptional activator/tetratricopeptide (TPR) repeat protein
MIRLQTLGTLDLKDSGGGSLRSVLAQPRRVALLVHLAVARPHGFQRRDRLLGLFWPEHDGEQARASLSRAIYFLRRELGSEMLVSRGHEEIGLNLDHIWCDARAFDHAIDRGQPGAALELYRGDLLPGFFASNAPGFEQWLESERARLRERGAECAWTLAAAEEARGNFPLAAHWARRGVAFAPFHEVGVRRLLDLLDRAGDRASAAHAYLKFADALASELELTPSPETRALIDAIRARESQRGEASVPVVVSAQDSAVTPQASESPTSDSARIAQPVPRKRRMRRWPLATLAVFGLVVGLVSSAARRNVPIDPDRIDVLILDNRTGDRSLDRLGHRAAEQISESLRGTDRPVTVNLTERDWRHRWHAIAGALTGSPRTRAAIEVAGAFERERDTILFEAWITDARLARGFWAVAPVASAVDSLDAAIVRVGTRVRGGIGMMKTVGARLATVASAPPTHEAFLEFAEGLRLQAEGHHAWAAERFRVAVLRDSTFTWPLVYAAQTGMMHLKEAQTDSFLATLQRVRQRLPALQLHLLDYLQATRVEDWPGRHQAIRQAAELAPAHYGYAYAVSAESLNRPRETVSALSRNGLDTLLRNDPKTYWRVLTGALHQLGEHRNELAAARRARAYKPESIVALMAEINALIALHRIEAVHVRMDSLFSLPRDGYFDAAMALHVIVRELRAHGHRDAANEAAARAITWLRARPVEESTTQMHRWALGDFLYQAGQFDQADTLFQRLAAEDPNEVDYLGYLGSIAAQRGQRALAESIAARIEARQVFVPGPGQSAIVWRAMIAALLGERERALSLLTDAFGPAGAFEVHTYPEFEGLRDHPRFLEFMRAKG